MGNIYAHFAPEPTAANSLYQVGIQSFANKTTHISSNIRNVVDDTVAASTFFSEDSRKWALDEFSKRHYDVNNSTTPEEQYVAWLAAQNNNG